MTLEERRRRALHRARYRGFREADMLLGGFAATALPAMGEKELDEFERLLALPDHDLYGWAIGTAAPPAAFDGPVFRQLKAFQLRAP